jgi:glutaminase
MNLIHKILEQIYVEFKHKQNGGALANYIPQLTMVNPGNLGITVTTIDGYQYTYGDVATNFTIQSVSKPFIYGMALQACGVENVMTKISVEPSGDSFNSISLYPDSGRPFNPMINAGAIAATGLLWDVYQDRTFDCIMETFNAFAGENLTLDDSVYSSESETGHRNRAIAYLLRNFGILTSDVNPPLETYFKQCSINVNCSQLSVMGATLANNGVNPITGKEVIDQEFVPKVLSVMSSCGMYDYSGEWIYNVGLPAKSGVGGGVLAVLPGQLAISVYSPLLMVSLSQGLEHDISVNSGSGDAVLDFNGNEISGLVIMTADKRQGEIHAPFPFDKEEEIDNGGSTTIKKTARLGNESVEIRIGTGSGNARINE